MKLDKIINKQNNLRAILAAIIISSSIGVCNRLKQKEPKEMSEDIYEYLYDTEKDESRRQDIDSLDSLVLNASTCDFKNLEQFPNLKEIRILNPEELTKEDKKTINSYKDLETIDLVLSEINIDTNLDLEWIEEDKNIIIDKNATLGIYRPDLIDLYLYNLYDNLKQKEKNRTTIKCFDQERMEELTRWHYVLNSIVNSFAFTEGTTREEKIMAIIYYVTRALEYDPEVSEILNQEKEKIWDEKVHYYNQHLLKSIFEKEDNYGICCNYAALTSMLGYYAEVPLEYANGTYFEETSSEHAWCTYNDLIVDPTFLDQNQHYLEISEYLKNTKDEELRKEYQKHIRREIFTISNRYKEKIPLWQKFDDDREKRIKYRINEEEKDIYKLNQKLLLICEMINSVAILLLGEDLINKKEDEKDPCLTKK